jgi:hypothetical protein
MIVDAHHGVGVKIHTLRSMASTINTSRNESFFWLQRCNIGGTLTVGGGTFGTGDGTLQSTVAP